MYKIEITQRANKELDKIKKGNEKIALKIEIFLSEVLSNETNPRELSNATKLKGYNDKYRWRIGDYRIIGIIKDDILTIEIIKISTRQGAYK